MNVITLYAALAMAGQITEGERAISPDTRRLLTTFREEFVEITPGRGVFPASYMRGGAAENQRPKGQVTLEYDFCVARFEVPQNLWEAVMGNNPSRWKGPRNSVEMVSFEDARQFCNRVTELLRTSKLIGPRHVVRLPSEAQWEYVARAGTTTAYSFGDDAKDLDEYAWHTGNAAGNDPPVGAKRPNPWKLYDVHGYLWEWCADDWHDDYRGAPRDGSAWTSADDNPSGVLRGGSWKDPAEKLTCAFRRRADRTLRDDAVGLRCVLATRSSHAFPIPKPLP